MTSHETNQPSDLSANPNPTPKPEAKPKPAPVGPRDGSRNRDRARRDPARITTGEAWVEPMSSGLARLAEESDPSATSLELSPDAGLSVPAGEPPALDPEGEDGTDGRSA